MYRFVIFLKFPVSLKGQYSAKCFVDDLGSKIFKFFVENYPKYLKFMSFSPFILTITCFVGFFVHLARRFNP